jgi:hypothetical protein
LCEENQEEAFVVAAYVSLTNNSVVQGMQGDHFLILVSQNTDTSFGMNI